MNRQRVGEAAVLIGTTLNMTGAVLNSLGGALQKDAFCIWMFSNGIFVCYFYGIHKKWWEVNMGAIAMILMYIFFFCTATYGWLK